MTAVTAPPVPNSGSLPAPAEPAHRTRGGLVAARSRNARRLAWNLSATTVIWLTSLFVIALWVSGGGVQALVGGDAEALNSLGRLTGLVASNLLLYQVILMARVPLFERGFGRDGITRMHRLVGFWSLSLMVAHIALLAWGYAARAGINVLVQLWEFVWDYPGMLLATAGTILLILVAVTSLRRARRRLRYESWHLLHLYAYLGVGLALPHQLWTGADFLSSPAATAYWWGLWAVSAACIVVFRLALPVIRSLRHRLRVIDVRDDGDGAVAVTMTGRRLHRLRAQAGQFFIWRFLDGPGSSRGNPFSLAAAPDGQSLTIAARVVGDGTARLRQLRPGTPVMIEGPYGVMTGDSRTGSKLLMIGAGAGVAPLVALLESEPYRPGDAVLLTRDHDARAALRVDAIAALIAHRGLRHAPMPGPRAHSDSPWLPASHSAWRGADVIRYLAPDLEEYDIFVCGPAAWMTALTRDLYTAGARRDSIHHESFTF